ncbi:MAG: hypothetical protein JW909_03595 [Planctomycetes bacterium]|nr:hypothetical protein [Planctomycetota bacterium]
MADRKTRVIENEALKLEMDLKDLSCRILHKGTGVEWRMAGASDKDVTLIDDDMELNEVSLGRFGKAFDAWERPGSLMVRVAPAGLAVTAEIDGEDVIFEVRPEFTDGPAARDVLYPRHMIIPVKAGNYTVFPLSQGSIIPADWPDRFHHPEGYSEQAMAFHGAYVADGDCGYAAIAETPDDMYLAVWHDAGAAASTFIHWLPSMGALAYTRRVRYMFRRGMDYRQQAFAYRQYAMDKGFYVSLKEKAKRNPNLEKLHGGCVVNCSAAARNFRNMSYRFLPFATTAERVEKFRKLTGIENASIHLDGWGKYGYDNVHPDTLPPNSDCGGARGLRELSERVKAAGYLFGLHDQYIDNFMDAPSFLDENFRYKEDGEPVKVNNWNGGMAYHNCYAASLRFVKRNIFEGVRDLYMYHNSPPVVDICAPTAYYLDCFTRTVECYNPEHPLSRTENRAVQLEILRTVRTGNNGQTPPIVLQIEHVRDFAIPELDFSYGLGHLTADVETTDGGHAARPVGIAVPIWHLAFHDTVILPHAGDQMHNLLYGNPCWFGLGEETWEERVSAELEIKQLVLKLHADIGFEPMTGHELLAADGTVEKTDFGGVCVTANRAEKTVKIEGGRADTGGEIKVGN